MTFTSTSLAFLLATSSILAEKDGSYYPNGVTNPAAKHRMYWHDSHNVMSDLSQFDALYVKYHSCAWSEYIDEDGGGGGGEEGDTWYLGAVPSFRPNVAYSLYGILNGKKDSGCNKRTYINSFHTTNGLEAFTNVLALNGYSNFQYVNDEGGGNDNENYGGSIVTSQCSGSGDSHDNNNGDDYFMSNGNKYNSYSSSYGTGCSKGKFVKMSYQGQYCDANSAEQILDDLQQFNSNLEKDGKCVQIYNGKNAYNAEEDADADDMGPLALLMYSRACNVRDNTNSCPDPYGRLKKYARQLEHSVGSVRKVKFLGGERLRKMSWSFFAMGVASTLAAALVFLGDLLKHRKQNRKRNRKKSIFKQPRKSRNREKSPRKERRRTKSRSKSRSRQIRSSRKVTSTTERGHGNVFSPGSERPRRDDKSRPERDSRRRSERDGRSRPDRDGRSRPDRKQRVRSRSRSRKSSRHKSPTQQEYANNYLPF